MTYLVASAQQPSRGGASYAYVPLPDGRVRVDVAMPCGHRFEGVAFIHDPSNGNPSLEVPRPLGFVAVIEIMDGWIDAGRPHAAPLMPAPQPLAPFDITAPEGGWLSLMTPDELVRAAEPEQSPEDELTL